MDPSLDLRSDLEAEGYSAVLASSPFYEKEKAPKPEYQWYHNFGAYMVRMFITQVKSGDTYSNTHLADIYFLS